MLMRKEVGWCVAQAYRLVGARLRALAAVRKPGVVLPIAFHGAEAGEVRAVLAWLRRAGILDRVELTFDDGWLQFKETLRVLEEFEKRAILFIAPGQTRQGRIWTDGISVPQRQALYGLDEAMRTERLEAWRVPSVRHLMTESDVRQLARHPLVRIGNHTWSHLSCTNRPQDEVMAEVCRAQEVLTDWCGVAPKDFAYPFGRGTAELDGKIRAMGLVPHYTRQGFVTRETRGEARNLFCEGQSLAENVGRVLMAWPTVGTTL